MKLKLDCDLEKLVKAFEAAPEKVRQMVRVQMKMAARDIKEHAATHHRYKTRSGNMERSGVETAVEDSRAEIFLSPAVPYGVFLHEGTKAHNIVPRSKQALRWVNGNEFKVCPETQIIDSCYIIRINCFSTLVQFLAECL